MFDSEKYGIPADKLEYIMKMLKDGEVTLSVEDVSFNPNFDIEGCPTDCWIARKLIPTKPAFHAFYGEMPIVKERRYFVHDAQVMCHHPYWPLEAFDELPVSVPNLTTALCQLNDESDDEVSLLSELSSEVGKVVGGAWSIDWLWSEDEGRWYLIDMAEAAMSYHWPGCESKII